MSFHGCCGRCRKDGDLVAIWGDGILICDACHLEIDPERIEYQLVEVRNLGRLDDDIRNF